MHHGPLMSLLNRLYVRDISVYTGSIMDMVDVLYVIHAIHTQQICLIILMDKYSKYTIYIYKKGYLMNV